MADTIREQIIQAIETQMATVRISGGYNTDCGATVYRGAIEIPSSNMPAINIIPGIEDGTRQYGRQVCIMPVEIQAYQVHATSNPLDIGEAALGDLIKAMLTDRDWGELAEDTEYTGGGTLTPGPEDIATMTSAVFRVRYSTLIGNPYAQ